MKHFSAKLNGETVLVQEVDWEGLWMPAGLYKTSGILIQPKLRKWQLAECLLHEGLHAEFPHMKEAEVHRAAGELMVMLRKSGVFDGKRRGKKEQD
jgi:hypothetical protein